MLVHRHNMKDLVAKVFEIKVPFPGGAKGAVPACFIQNFYGTTSVTHTLVACDFGDIDQDRWDGVV